jgi:hypothetical protein
MSVRDSDHKEKSDNPHDGKTNSVNTQGVNNVKHGTRERGSANYPERVDQSVFLSTKRQGHQPFNPKESP